MSRGEGVTMYMWMLAAFKALLHRYTGQTDIVVGSDIANRTRVATESLIGFFANQLVLRTDLSGNPSFRELLGRVRRITLDGYAHQDLPFEKLVAALHPERDPSRNPLFQIMFIMQNAPMKPLELPDLKVESIEIEQETSVFDISVSLSNTERGAIGCSARYNVSLFDRSMIIRLLRDFLALLDGSVADPGARLSDFELPSEIERKRQASEKNAGNEARLKKLMGLKPKAMSLSQKDLVKTGYLKPDQTLPLVVEPDHAAVDLVEWVGANPDLVKSQLCKHGALLFRNFSVDSIARFEQFAQAISPDLMEYGERSSPRTSLGGAVYTSTDHPADQYILLHNEQSYTLNWPMKIWFFCIQPAKRQGATPIADSRKIYERLNQSVKKKFADKQVMYVRTYGHGLGLPWQVVFQTQEKSAVERHCRDSSIDWEWLDGDMLRTRQIRPALRPHPKTAELVWFNHALFFHISSLELSQRQSILAGVDQELLPFNTYYGDGSEIEPEVLDAIRDAYQQETIAFSWQKGDLLMIDNMLVAHGREPFVGPREIAVIMGEPFNNAEREGK